MAGRLLGWVRSAQGLIVQWQWLINKWFAESRFRVFLFRFKARITELS